MTLSTTTATPQKLTPLIAVNPTEQQPVQRFESTSITIGDILVALALGGALITVIRSLIVITTQAHQLKSSFEQRDLLLNSKVDNLINRIDQGFARIDKEYDRLDKRFNKQAARIGEIIAHLAKEGFTLQSWRSDED